MVKKTIVFIILIIVLVLIGFLVYQKSIKTKNDSQFLKSSGETIEEISKYEFNFEEKKYEFKHPKNWSVEKKSTNQFKNDDEFKIKDDSNNELISFTILSQEAEGPAKQSFDPKNEIDIKINNIDGSNFLSSDGKNIYMLNDGQFVYLWINNSADNLIFDEIVKSFQKL